MFGGDLAPALFQPFAPANQFNSLNKLFNAVEVEWSGGTNILGVTMETVHSLEIISASLSTPNNILDDGSGNITIGGFILGNTLGTGTFAIYDNTLTTFGLQVADDTVTTLLNTLDDGNGNQTIAGHIAVTGSFGIFGATPPASQFAAIGHPTGGTTIDTQCRAAVVSILNVLSEGAGGYGFTA